MKIYAGRGEMKIAWFPHLRAVLMYNSRLQFLSSHPMRHAPGSVGDIKGIDIWNIYEVVWIPGQAPRRSNGVGFTNHQPVLTLFQLYQQDQNSQATEIYSAGGASERRKYDAKDYYS